MNQLSDIPLSALLSELEGRRLSIGRHINMVRRAMPETLEHQQNAALIDDATGIISKTCATWGVSHRVLMSRNRSAFVAEARMAAMAALRARGHTLQEIAKVFKKKDHGTVMHAVKTIANRAASDHRLAERMTTISQPPSTGLVPT